MLSAAESQDPDGDLPLNYLWTITSNAHGAVATAQSTDVTVTLNFAGVTVDGRFGSFPQFFKSSLTQTYDVTLIVTDATGTPSDPVTASLAIPPCNLAPWVREQSLGVLGGARGEASTRRAEASQQQSS